MPLYFIVFIIAISAQLGPVVPESLEAKLNFLFGSSKSFDIDASTVAAVASARLFDCWYCWLEHSNFSQKHKDPDSLNGVLAEQNWLEDLASLVPFVGLDFGLVSGRKMWFVNLASAQTD